MRAKRGRIVVLQIHISAFIAIIRKTVKEREREREREKREREGAM